MASVLESSLLSIQLERKKEETVICAFIVSLLHHYYSLSLPKKQPDQSPRYLVSLTSFGSQVSNLAPT